MITKKIISMITLCSLTLVVGAQSAVTLTAGDFEITPGGKATLTIDSDIALGEYCSFQFDLLLPEGITMPYNMNPDEEEDNTSDNTDDTTAAPDVTTEAPAQTTAASTTEKKGCGSAVTGVFALVMLVGTAGALLAKKKD